MIACIKSLRSEFALSLGAAKEIVVTTDSEYDSLDEYQAELLEPLKEVFANDRMFSPEFEVGDRVEVVLNDRNQTPRRGTIRDSIWHTNNEEWNYYLEVSGKKIGKRYMASDLRKQSR